MKKDFLKQFKGCLLNQVQMKNLAGGTGGIGDCENCDNCGVLDRCCPPKHCCAKPTICGNANQGYDCRTGPCPGPGG